MTLVRIASPPPRRSLTVGPGSLGSDDAAEGAPPPTEVVFNAPDAPGVEADADAPASTLLPSGLISDGEIIILQLRPSLLYVPLSCLTSLAFIALIACFLAYLARWQPGWFGWSDTSAFILGGSLIMLRVGWQALEWVSRVYVLTDRRVIRRMGVLRVAIFETQLRNIQHTGIFTRVRERCFGLGTLGFATAGSDTFEAFWVMIRDPVGVQRTVVQAIERYGRKKL